MVLLDRSQGKERETVETCETGRVKTAAAEGKNSFMFHTTLQAYEDIIAAVEKLDVQERYDLIHVKAHLVLVDGTQLRVSEVWINEELEKYSYYWLEEDNDVILGWDNAPHHEDVDTFPHHRHEEGEVHASEAVNADKVLQHLREEIAS
jgi:hypothetical protein